MGIPGLLDQHLHDGDDDDEDDVNGGKGGAEPSNHCHPSIWEEREIETGIRKVSIMLG